jgi:peroxin-6
MRGRGSDAGGVMDRVVSQLLTEMDAMPAHVFVIGATNRPDLIESALLRPGRFDRLLYLGLSKDQDAQCKILQALTRQFYLAPDVDLAKVRTCVSAAVHVVDIYIYIYIYRHVWQVAMGRHET